MTGPKQKAGGSLMDPASSDSTPKGENLKAVSGRTLKINLAQSLYQTANKPNSPLQGTINFEKLLPIKKAITKVNCQNFDEFNRSKISMNLISIRNEISRNHLKSKSIQNRKWGSGFQSIQLTSD